VERTEPTMRELVLARAEDDATALVGGGGSWTWREHVRQSARRAQWLLERRDPGRPFNVGVLLENLPEYSFLLGAASLAGAALVGLNPTRSPSELARDIAHTDCQLVLTDAGGAQRLGAAAAEVVEVDGEHYATQLAALGDVGVPDAAVAAEDRLLLVFTSGTTSDPKAVICSQRKIAWTAQSAEGRGYRPDDVAYCAMPLFHSGAIMAVWAPMLALGGTIVLRRRFSASRFVDDLLEHRCTIAHYVGKPLAYVLAQPERPEERRTRLRAVFGNEGAERDIAEFRRRFRCEVHDGYGSTELGIGMRRVPGTPPGALGAPTEGDVRVLDPETGRECPRAELDREGRLRNPEAVGELVRVDGPGLFEGYYANPEADRERLRDGVFHSGDLAYRDAEGYFYFAGRTGEWLRVDGENLAVVPVERSLRELPGVVAVAVYAVPDPFVGDQPMAALVTGEGAAVGAEELTRWWRTAADLSPKARPRFVRLSASLPQTATHKVLKRELAAEGWTCDEPVLWAPEPDADYRELTAADRAELRERFARQGRSHLVSA
jgi:fatty-acyl-CoA synthase